MAHFLHTVGAPLVPAEKIDHTAQRNPQPAPWQAVGTLSDDELRGLLMALKERKGA